jgi:hypothetical protein
MKTMAAIDLSVTKEVTLDADAGELLNIRIQVAMVGLGDEWSTMPAYINKLAIKDTYLTF